MAETQATDADRITTIRRRVDYSETDQQGVVYHARYLVWLDVARTEHLRMIGMSYRELEAAGFRLMVSELTIRYRRSARYDDPIRVRTWVRARRIATGHLRLCRRARRERHAAGDRVDGAVRPRRSPAAVAVSR